MMLSRRKPVPGQRRRSWLHVADDLGEPGSADEFGASACEDVP
jgi:hypothetical protein